MGTVHGVPIGVSFIGLKDEDAKVLSFGYAYEQATNHRANPQYLASAEVRPEIEKIMRNKYANRIRRIEVDAFELFFIYTDVGGGACSDSKAQQNHSNTPPGADHIGMRKL